MADHAPACLAEYIADRLLAYFNAQVRPWLIRGLREVLGPRGGNDTADEPDAIEAEAAAWIGRYRTRQKRGRCERRTLTPRCA